MRVEPRGRDVRVAVADEGPGIPHADQERVFEKFFRGDPKLSTRPGGTGLGLYISRELVERMGGRLAVESEPGRRRHVLVRPAGGVAAPGPTCRFGTCPGL